MTVVSGAPFIINFVTAVFDIIFKSLQCYFFNSPGLLIKALSHLFFNVRHSVLHCFCSAILLYRFYFVDVTVSKIM